MARTFARSPAGPPERLVRDALGHLHDLRYLQTHPLAALAGGGKALQGDLAAAIAGLDGGGRLGQLLALRYGEALEPNEVWNRVGVGKTEYYHAHRRAVAAVASALGEKWGNAGGRTGGRLPAALTSFVGRRREIAEVGARLRGGARLLTLTGAPGTGKTRLALEASRGLAGAFPDGVAFVPLAPVGDPDLVWPTVAAALGAQEAGGRSAADAIAAIVRGRRFMLVLDNLEHVLEAAPTAAVLLGACPGLAVLATSRERLRVDGEEEYAVPPLDLPATASTADEARGNDAVRLLVDRARAANGGFALDDANVAAVVAICRRLDGLPLAIELAAARLNALTPAELLARLATGPFALLTSGVRGAPPHHRTLRALVDWSHDALAPAEQAVFRRLAVFAGGWTLAAAEAVCTGSGVTRGVVLDALMALVDRSLVVAEVGGEETRYRLLETLRAYAWERLDDAGESEAARQRHAELYLALAEPSERGLKQPGYQRWLARLAAEHDNFRAALAWAEASDVELGLRLAGSLSWFWWLRGHGVEGGAWLERLLDAGADGAPAVRAEALEGAAQMALRRGDTRRARALTEAELDLRRGQGDCAGEPFALARMGVMLTVQGEYPAGQRLMEDALALAQEQGEAWVLGFCHGVLCNNLRVQGHYDRALAHGEAGLALYRATGEPWGQAILGGIVAGLALRRGDAAGAAALADAALEQCRRGGLLGTTSTLLRVRALVACETGDGATAERLAQESLVLSQQAGAQGDSVVTLKTLAAIARLRGERVRSARLFGAAEHLRATLGGQIAHDRLYYDGEQAALREQMGEPDFARSWEEGRAMTTEEAVGYALEMPSP